MKTFKDFADKKDRSNKKHLEIVYKVCEQGGLKVSNHLDDDEPYIFVRNNAGQTLSFDGVRIYSIGDSMAYRVQKDENTHPYGRAYLLDLEEMFEDLVSDNTSTEDAAKEIIKTVSENLKGFFDKSEKAEIEIRDDDIDKEKDPLGRAAVKSTGTDYSNTVTSKGTNYGG